MNVENLALRFNKTQIIQPFYNFS